MLCLKPASFYRTYVILVYMALKLIENVQCHLGFVLATFVENWSWLLLIYSFGRLPIYLLGQIFKWKFVIFPVSKTLIGE